jgi:DNA-binding Lrp family transcriptional regulator
MNFTTQQNQIIELLKAYKPLTLAEISVKLNLNKSSVLYQLEELVKEKILKKDEISPRKIKYSLVTKDEIEDYINLQTLKLSNLLTNKPLVGQKAYEDLLMLVAKGEGDIWGYCNLEEKVIPEMMDTIEKYRDMIAASRRNDIFVITNTKENIELLKDHKRKKSWIPWFIGKIITKDVLDVNCDIYVWDGKVGICSFEENSFKVTIHEDKATYKLLQGLLQVLFENAKTEEEYKNHK